MDKIPLTIVTCCILHNICIEVRDDVDVDPEDDDPDELPSLPGHMNREFTLNQKFRCSKCDNFKKWYFCKDTFKSDLFLVQ